MPASLVILSSALTACPNGAARCDSNLLLLVTDAPPRSRTASPSIDGPARHPARSHPQCRQVRIAPTDSSSGQRAIPRDRTRARTWPGRWTKVLMLCMLHKSPVRVVQSISSVSGHDTEVSPQKRTASLSGAIGMFPLENTGFARSTGRPSESDAPGTLAAIGESRSVKELFAND